MQYSFFGPDDKNYDNVAYILKIGPFWYFSCTRN